jgi:DNA-binding protein HU-beta
MNKAELVDGIAARLNTTKVAASHVVNSIFIEIATALNKGDEVAIAGFGTFAIRKRAARTGRNPITGQPLKIAASKGPSFRAAKKLKDLVR